MCQETQNAQRIFAVAYLHRDERRAPIGASVRRAFAYGVGVVQVTVVAVDVGSLANIGWWRERHDEATHGHDLDALIEVVAADLLAGVPVALGFEAPLFIPRPPSACGLNRQRAGDRGRPWCAGAGTGALALGIQQAAYVFAGLAERVRPTVSFRPEALADGSASLLIWEAFVSGKSKDRSAIDPHVNDARLAVIEFRSRLALGHVHSDVEDLNVLNLAAAGLLAAGLTADVELLTQPCVVVKPPIFVTEAERREL